MCAISSDDDKGKKTVLILIFFFIIYMSHVFLFPCRDTFFSVTTLHEDKNTFYTKTLISSVELIVYCWLCSHKKAFTSH